MALTQLPDELVVRSVAGLSTPGAEKVNPCKITATSHGFITGDTVYMVGVEGMTEINNREFTITRVNDDSFTLDDEDATGYGVWSGGGTARQRLGTAARYNVGTGVEQLVQLDDAAKMPAVDGSQLTGLNTGPQLLGTSPLTGTTVSFTGIPSSARRVTMVVQGSTFNASGDYPIIQLGRSTGYVSSGYDGALFMDKKSLPENEENRFDVELGFRIGGDALYTTAEGNIVAEFIRGTGHVWTARIVGNFLDTDVNFVFGTGSVDVGAQLDRIQVKSAGGAVTWSAGNVTVYYS